MLLAQISLQLSSFNVNPSFINSTAPSASAASSSFHSSVLDVRINILWFLSLAISLIASLFAILVQQWLFEYAVRRPTTVRQGVHLRQLRYNALQDWGVYDIVALLPVLLQIALILFLVGLFLLLWSLNSVVATIVSVFLSVPITFFVATTLLPILYPSSPYKSTTTTILITFVLFVRASIFGTATACVATCCAFRGCTRLRRRTRFWDPVLDHVKVMVLENNLIWKGVTTRVEWMNSDFSFIQAQNLQQSLELAAVRWSPHVLSDDDVGHLGQCWLDIPRYERAQCILDRAYVVFDIPPKVHTVGWNSSYQLEAILRRCRDPPGQVVVQLRASLLDLLVSRDVARWELTDSICMCALTLLRHLVRLDPPPSASCLVSYQRFLLDAKPRFLEYSNDIDRIVLRSLLDCLVAGLFVIDDSGAIRLPLSLGIPDASNQQA